MYTEDNEYQVFLFCRVFPVCGIIILLLWILKRNQKKIFAMVMKYVMEEPMIKATVTQRRKLFADLAVSKDSLEILEIGAGTGTNFSYYSHTCKVTCLEPNGAFNPYITENEEKMGFPVKNVSVVRGFAEDMGSVPTDSVDAVVCTFVLCSVDSVASVLREVKRVLKPGGKFYFMEHIVTEKSGLLYLMQVLFTPLWIVIFDDCRLTRDTVAAVETAGFSSTNITRFNGTYPFVFVLKPLCMGTATK